MRQIEFVAGLAVAVLSLAAAGPAMVVAQGTPVQIGVVYTCPEPLRLKVLSCAGAEATSPCDLQGYNHTLAARRGTVPRSQVIAMLQSCHVQTTAEAQADARGAASGAAAGGSTQQTSANGINVGDSVQVLTGFGWTPAKVVGINGNSYRVVVNGIQLNKDYPSEVRRVGGATAHDHANGQFRLGDRVQVHVDGRWAEGKIMTEMGTDYQVSLPGNRMTWATAQDLRPSAVAEAAPAAATTAPRAGVPPKPGLTSCAGKIEGRYATTGSAMASFTMTFRSGKVTATDGGGNDEVYECWMGGEKVYLHQPAHTNMDMTLDINNDGTLQTPMGEIRKKGN